MPYDEVIPYMKKPVGAAVVVAGVYNAEVIRQQCVVYINYIIQGMIVAALHSDEPTRDITRLFDFFSIALLLLVLFFGWRFVTDIKTKIFLSLLSIACYCLVFNYQQKLSDFKPEDFEKILEPIYKDWFIEQEDNQKQVSAKGGCVAHPEYTICGPVMKPVPRMPKIRYQPAVKACSDEELKRLVHEMRFSTMDNMLSWTMNCWTDAELTGEHYCDNLKHVYSNAIRVSPGDLQKYCPHQLGDHTRFAFWTFLLVVVLHVVCIGFSNQMPRAYESHSRLDGDDPSVELLTSSH
jgi:hypothetical protein